MLLLSVGRPYFGILRRCNKSHDPVVSAAAVLPIANPGHLRPVEALPLASSGLCSCKFRCMGADVCASLCFYPNFITHRNMACLPASFPEILLPGDVVLPYQLLYKTHTLL
jgi:hypothetical protein